MSKVLILSRTYPSYHPKKGKPTNFVEKLYNSLNINFHKRSWIGMLNEINNKEIEYLQRLAGFVFGGIDYKEVESKHTTIRAGSRFKVGDKFSPRVWSGKPYNSKQIIIAPDIEIKKVWDFTIINNKIIIGAGYYSTFMNYLYNEEINKIACNDGLSFVDFRDWFLLSPKYKKTPYFKGQIICWNENIQY